ncbi:hypothetical protein NDU88_003821 [Pleurodeles waltl]|uniref:Uncharacterized protein n=1 Tax=Pleurodeles waltl TaxID=8319 RepID=A0AAV7V045_PLEWA|nr:hypothetical protein NDU88_003821 [Pleurodeles waltl]
MHSLPRSEKFTARRTGTAQSDFARRRSTRRTADLGRHSPTSRGEIDAVPAVREKIPHNAHQINAALVTSIRKPRIPRTDPGASENPATQRGSTTLRQKLTHSRPCVETKRRITVCGPRNRRTPLCFLASPPLQPFAEFFHVNQYFVCFKKT